MCNVSLYTMLSLLPVSTDYKTDWTMEWTHTIWTLLPDLWTLNGHSVMPYPTEHQGTTDKSSPRLLLLGSQWLLPGTHTKHTLRNTNRPESLIEALLLDQKAVLVLLLFLSFVFCLVSKQLLSSLLRKSRSTLYRHQTVQTESFLQTRASPDVMFVEYELKAKNLWWIFAPP